MSDFIFNPRMTQEEKLLFVRKELLDKIKKQTCRIDELEKEVIRLQHSPKSKTQLTLIRSEFVRTTTVLNELSKVTMKEVTRTDIVQILMTLGYIEKVWIKGKRANYRITAKGEEVMRLIENNDKYKGIEKFEYRWSFVTGILIRKYEQLNEFYKTFGEAEA